MTAFNVTARFRVEAEDEGGALGFSRNLFDPSLHVRIKVEQVPGTADLAEALLEFARDTGVAVPVGLLSKVIGLENRLADAEGRRRD